MGNHSHNQISEASKAVVLKDDLMTNLCSARTPGKLNLLQLLPHSVHFSSLKWSHWCCVIQGRLQKRWALKEGQTSVLLLLAVEPLVLCDPGKTAEEMSPEGRPDFCAASKNSLPPPLKRHQQWSQLGDPGRKDCRRDEPQRKARLLCCQQEFPASTAENISSLVAQHRQDISWTRITEGLETK